MPTDSADVDGPVSYSVVFGNLPALRAGDTFRPSVLYKPFQAGVIIGELSVEVLNRGSVASVWPLSNLATEYHYLPLMSRDSYLRKGGGRRDLL